MNSHRTTTSVETLISLVLAGLLMLIAVPAASILAQTPKPDGKNWWYAKGVLVVNFREGVDKSGFQMGVGRAATGLTDVDHAISQSGVRTIDKLFRQTEATYRSNSAPLYNYYRIFFDTTRDLETIASRFAALDEVKSVEFVGVHRVTAIPNDPSFSALWGLNQSGDNDIDAPEAWDSVVGDSSILVGAMDTGVQWDHPDLAGPAPYTNGNIWINWAEYNGTPGVDDDQNGYIDDIRGWDWVQVLNSWPGEDGTLPDNDPMDFNGHGTHTSGTMAAITNNGIGVSGIAGGWTGTTPGCKIVPLRIGWSQSYNGYEYGYVRMDFAAQAFEYAADKGVDVVNCSWGSSNSGGLGAAVSYATSNGMLVVTAAGNDNNQTPSYLSTRSDVISVAALTSSGTKSSFSSYGTWVDLAAPGSGIYSTYSNHGSPGYAYESGTSMASPHVAGVVALLRSKLPDIRATALDTILLQTADYIYDKNPSYVGLLGAGRVNAASALAAITIAKPGADVTIGPAPLDVNFQVDSPINLNSLTYYFGDGDSLAGFSALHQYHLPGAYDVQLDANSMHGDTLIDFPEYIVAYADTIQFEDFAGSADDGVSCVVRFHNFAPIRSIELPIEYSGALALVIDSVSVAGYRAADFDTVKIQSVDNAAQRMDLRLVMDTGSPDFAAGDGELLKLYFSFTSAPGFSATHSIDVMPYGAYVYQLDTPAGSYQPDVIGGTLDIHYSVRGDANLSGGISIADAIFIIDFVFGGGPTPSLYNGDANGDLTISVADAVYLITYIFGGGPPPPQ